MRQSRKTKRKLLSFDSKGFTLLETMVGMLVFSIGILGIAAMQTNAIRNNTLAEEVQQATAVALTEIEVLMATDYLDQRIKSDGTSCEDTDDGKFNICVQRLDNDAMPGAKKVDVTANFALKNGAAQTLTLKIFKPLIKSEAN
jgi:prepilin-type N-terminal cleavage/methylation domain-containing protein